MDAAVFCRGESRSHQTRVALAASFGGSQRLNFFLWPKNALSRSLPWPKPVSFQANLLPDNETSTLSPLSHGLSVFLRETHLAPAVITIELHWTFHKKNLCKTIKLFSLNLWPMSTAVLFQDVGLLFDLDKTGKLRHFGTYHFQTLISRVYWRTLLFHVADYSSEFAASAKAELKIVLPAQDCFYPPKDLLCCRTGHSLAEMRQEEWTAAQMYLRSVWHSSEGPFLDTTQLHVKINTTALCECCSVPLLSCRTAKADKRSKGLRIQKTRQFRFTEGVFTPNYGDHTFGNHSGKQRRDIAPSMHDS